MKIDGQRKKHRRIRRVSMDKFYEIVTGQEDAFYQMCMVLPNIINQVVSDIKSAIPNDTVTEDLNAMVQEDGRGTFALALFALGFSGYIGFIARD